MDPSKIQATVPKGDESDDESWDAQPETEQHEENEGGVQPQEILDRIRKENLDFSNPDLPMIKTFSGDYQRFFKDEKSHKKIPEPGNILHIFAQESSPDGNRKVNGYWTDEKIFDFLQWFLESHWQFLEAKTTPNNYYPLHTALSAKNHAFIQAVLDLRDSFCIDSVLCHQKNKDLNYIEIAVKHESPKVEAIARRCAQAKLAMWAPPDEETKWNNSPLHAAVTKVCYMEKSLGETLLSQPGSKTYVKNITNVYKEWKQQCARKQRTGSANMAAKVAFKVPHGFMGGSDRAETEGEEPIELGSVSRRDIARLVLDLIDDYQQSRKPLSQVKIVKLFIHLSQDSNALGCRISGKTEHTRRTPYQERIAKLENVWEKTLQAVKTDKLEVREDSLSGMTDEDAKRMIITEDPVAEAIRYHCLRYFDRDQIERCLYEPGSERNIDFDLAGLRSSSISRAFLARLAKHLRFESILKYVALPKLALEEHGFEINGQGPDEGQPKNRKDVPDLRAVFQWLRENNVKRILRVTVIDYGTPCHSDAVIEEALQGFQVETWDWKKIDLCTDVVAKSTSVVRHVSLYSSGKNAVLMGWGSSDGLGDRKKFPKLERVRLFIAKGEEGDRRAAYIEAFESKVKAMTTYKLGNGETNDEQTDQWSEEASGRIAVEHHLDDGKVSYAADFKNDEIPEQQEVDWINKIKAFSTFMSNIPKPEREKIAPVKIAVIDDGVDSSLDFLVGKIGGGKSFSPYSSSSDLMNAYYVPSGRHGTMMADLICQICPSCQLYVARLDERPSRSGSGRQITLESATQAVKWATDCKVDIISMSWTIEVNSTDRKETEITKFGEAIANAKYGGILMFCAVSDQGSIANNNCYPGKCGDCISIGAATASGDKCTWVPEPYEYLFPGKNIPFRWNHRDGVLSWYESGSSLATALAAGLGGLLLYCSRAVGESSERSAHVKTTMTALLNRLSQLSKTKFTQADIWLGDKFREHVKKANELKHRQASISSGGVLRAGSTPLSEMQWDETTKEALKNLLQDMTKVC